jgi:starch phosphorylase
MLENEIVPLYFAKNSKGYSPEWIQYIKRSIGNIAPHFTMKRMIDDYIDRFYNKEAARKKRLAADGFAIAKSIVAWKEKVAAAWNGVKMLDIKNTGEMINGVTGQEFHVEVVLDTNGLGRDLGVEQVVFRQENGVEHFWYARDLQVVKEDGSTLTYALTDKIKDAGVFRYGFRIYPKNAELPHRQDFAYTHWI